VPLQNGIEAPSQLAAQVGAGHALAGLCGTFSWVIAPGPLVEAATGIRSPGRALNLT
jgi:hypothetical protein